MFDSKYFNIGQIVVTRGIDTAMKENNIFASEVNLSLQRYFKKDWGDLSEEDKQMNDDALSNPDDLYILAAYQTCRDKIYIITNRISENPGDTSTTVCFPNER